MMDDIFKVVAQMFQSGVAELNRFERRFRKCIHCDRPVTGFGRPLCSPHWLIAICLEELARLTQDDVLVPEDEPIAAPSAPPRPFLRALRKPSRVSVNEEKPMLRQSPPSSRHVWRMDVRRDIPRRMEDI